MQNSGTTVMETTLKVKPKDGWRGLRENWRTDLVSGFIVSLIALPLSLGIAMASGFPPLSGVVAAVVGGVLVGLLSGSYVTINGPAAGLIVVILHAVEDLGGGDAAAGYAPTLAAIVVAGGLLVVFSALKAGKLGDFFPSAAVHGMMAAIGFIILTKQMHIALGVVPHGKSPFALIAELPQTIRKTFSASETEEAAVIGMISMGIIVLFPRVKNRFLRKIPAPLLVVAIAIVLEEILRLPENFLVPNIRLDSYTSPDFSYASSGIFWKVAITIALVQGMETLLSAAAVDRLDPYRRQSNLSRDMAAVGVGSIVSGFLGGLPMIAEIVRSSANINNGARTRWSNVFHGLFLLVFIVGFPWLIHEIPLSALAALLVFTGYRLASPKHFIEAYKTGPEQLVIFSVTAVVTLFTDLLVGVATGIAIKVVFHVINGVPLRSLFRAKVEFLSSGDKEYKLVFFDSVNFTNFIGVRRKLNLIPAGSKVILDFTDVKLIDHTVIEHLYDFSENHRNTGGTVDYVGLERLHASSDHPHAMRKWALDAKTEKLRKPTHRQRILAKFAHENELSFHPKIVTPFSVLREFPFYRYSPVRFQKNILIKNYPEYSIYVADSLIGKGGPLNTLEGSDEITIALIVFRHLKLPHFSLETETLFDKIFEIAGYDDIDFPDYPEFSKRYLLKGKDADAIRRFFTDAMLKWFEGYKGYHVEALDHAVMIHYNLSLLSADEIGKLYHFAEAFAVLAAFSHDNVPDIRESGAAT
jgi:MFS superfamily sulfate permease-like transporter